MTVPDAAAVVDERPGPLAACGYDDAQAEAASEDAATRSEVIRALVSLGAAAHPRGRSGRSGIPRSIVQFWHDLSDIPADVRQCIESWRVARQEGFELTLFGDRQARDFIATRYGPAETDAYDRCHHPAMRCDYFRLAYLLRLGGVYIDADDVYGGEGLSQAIGDADLIVQPLCFDVAGNTRMVPAAEFRAADPAPTWLFYCNNNPIMAVPGHPVLAMAFERATRLLIESSARTDISATTGPENFTRSLVRYVLSRRDACGAPLLIDWDRLAHSPWSLGYREDDGTGEAAWISMPEPADPCRGRTIPSARCSPRATGIAAGVRGRVPARSPITPSNIEPSWRSSCG